jgi:hypothetical protein
LLQNTGKTSCFFPGSKQVSGFCHATRGRKTGDLPLGERQVHASDARRLAGT